MTAVIVSRHAGIHCASELSADESELLVQVGRYGHDLVPWRSVDGSTIGPGNPWFLLAAQQVGWPMTYQGLHLLAAALLGLIAVIGFATVRLFLPLAEAGLVGLAGTLVLGCTATVNYLYFATELVPALALSLAAFCLIWAWQRRRAATAMLALSGGLAGFAPWAKLQAAPIALLLVGFAMWAGWWHFAATPSSGKRLALVARVIACALLPAAVIVTSVALGGAFPDFWASYIVANLGYAERFALGDLAVRLGHLLQRSELNGLMAAIAVVGVLRLVWRRSGRHPADRASAGVLPFSLLYLGAAVFACIRPPHEFEHYHVFLIGPLFVVVGAMLHGAGESRATEAGADLPRRLRWVVAAGVLAPAAFLSAGHYRDGAPLREHLAALQRDPERRFPTLVAQHILQIAPQAKSMVVWGWMPALYVKTGLASATRHAISHFLIDEGPSRDFLRRQFMNDIRSSAPDVIVDAVASGCFLWFWQIEAARLESFPELAAYVKDNYTLVLSVVSEPEGTPLRVFVRKPPGAPRPGG